MIKLSSLLCVSFLMSFSTQLMSIHSEEEAYLKEPAYKKRRIINDEFYALKIKVSRELIFTNKKVSRREGEIFNLGDRMTQLFYWDRIKVYLRGLKEDSSKQLISFSGTGKYPYVFDLRTLLGGKLKPSPSNGLDISGLTKGLEYNPQNYKLLVFPAEANATRQDQVSLKVKSVAGI